jgi:hypothetical protein
MGHQLSLDIFPQSGIRQPRLAEVIDIIAKLSKFVKSNDGGFKPLTQKPDFS